MHLQSLELTTGLTPAGQLDARLRSEEKKALAFCDWVLGDPVRGSALATAWLAQWHTVGTLNADSAAPTRGMLWRTLLTRLPARAPGLPEAKPEYQDLADLPLPARIAVLLALLGLPPEDGAEAMRLSMHAHAQRLGEGLPRLPDGAVDGERWQAWARALSAYVEHLPLDRTEALLQARLTGFIEDELANAEAAFDAVDEAHERHLARRNLLLVGVGCATLLALTFVPSVRERIVNPEVRVVTRALDAPVLQAPDRVAPTVQVPALQPVVQDLAFYAWFATQQLQERPATVLAPLTTESNPALPESEDAP